MILPYGLYTLVFDSTIIDTEFSAAISNSKIEDDYSLPLQLGYKQNSHFTGREKILETLSETLTASNIGSHCESPSAIILLGIGGVGKTQLARQYAYKYCSQHTSISWINSMSVETIYASFLEIARRIVLHYASRNGAAIPPYTNLAQHLSMPGLIDGDGQIVFSHITRGPVVEAVKSWFSLPDNKGWLLIFDNADDLDSFNIGEFFPTVAANGKILITTRRRECTRFGDEFELDVLEERESIKLFQRSCQNKQTFTVQGKYTVEFHINSPMVEMKLIRLFYRI
jgi:Cdc6-like AAA superfamily ATPase